MAKIVTGTVRLITGEVVGPVRERASAAGLHSVDADRPGASADRASLLSGLGSARVERTRS